MPDWTKCADLDFENDDSVNWTYCASFPAAVLFAVLFFAFTVAQIVQAFMFRKKFCWVIIMAGTWSTAGFALRAVSSRMMREEGIFIPMQLLIILAPLWLNAFIYMILGRMIHFFLPERKCFGVAGRKLTVIFLLLDIFSFLVQGASGSLMSSDTADLVKIGTNVYMGGVGMQELFILMFLCLAIRFHNKMNQLEAAQLGSGSLPWRPLLYTEYAGCFLITLRIIYRLIEYSRGYDSPLAKAEAAFYALDALPMVLAMALFTYFHPGRYLVGPDSEFPKKEKKAKKSKKTEKGDRGDVSSDNEVNDIHENGTANEGNISRGTSRRSRRSRRSRTQGMFGSMRDVESGTDAGLDQIPLRYGIGLHDGPAADTPSLPYPR